MNWTQINASLDILRTVKTCSVPQVPKFQCLFSLALWQSGQEHAGVNLQVVVVPLVDDAPGHAPVHHQGEVLHDAEQLNRVIFTIVENLVAEHGAHGIVADIVRHSYTPPAQAQAN